ncbi:MAG: threonine/serine exporter family protein [Flavonifractor sp.]|jgi:uncharacterized membrane protein YjjP (DUF1212 family)|nr:threonine/serine exporter family protein [Flavonifractor sp.]MCI9474439.1 threonine/serine exporter family protein [Flavonifractor sp.]
MVQNNPVKTVAIRRKKRYSKEAAPNRAAIWRKGGAPLDLDYDKLLGLTAELGYQLMDSGAEIYRVEESMNRLLRAYGVTTGEVFAIPNCIIVSLTTASGHALTQIRRMKPHGTDIERLELYNGLCRRLCGETPPVDEALSLVNQAGGRARSWSLPVQLAGYFLGCGVFSLFFGGNLSDMVCGGLCGVVVGLCMAFTAHWGGNLFFRTIASAAASALTAVFLVSLGLGEHVDQIIIGALMALVPGIALTNAMRDIMAGDMVSGISKAAEALLIGAAIALGTALSLGLFQILAGG